MVPRFRRPRAALRLLLLLLTAGTLWLGSQTPADVRWIAGIGLSAGGGGDLEMTGLGVQPTTTLTPPPPFPIEGGMGAIMEWEASLLMNGTSGGEGRSGTDGEHGERYLRFLNENWGVGFNNQLQEM